MAKKFQLSELKVKSFVTTLTPGEQKTTKGGFLYDASRAVRHRASKFEWTEVKTRVEHGNLLMPVGGRKKR